MGRRSLPLIGELLSFQRDRLRYLAELVADQGDIATARIGPYNVWVLVHPDHVRDVLMTNTDRFRKGPVLQRARVVLGDGLLTSEGETHQAHRKIVQPAFHSRYIKQYAHTMIAAATATAERWQNGRPIDLHSETVRFTLATAGATLLAADVDRDASAVERAVNNLLSAYKLAFLPFGWRVTRLPIGPIRRLNHGMATLYELVDRVLAKSDSATDDNVVTSLIKTHDLSDQQIRDHTVTMLLAGHETTANALAFAFHALALHPDVESRVHAEVDAVLEHDAPNPDSYQRLEMCNAVISETLRLFPPAWTIARQAMARHPVADSVIPSGDVVMLPQWIVHRDPRWWPAPDEFVPDRWLDDSSRDRPRWAYFPFGAGLRRCIGEGFAWTEGTLALAVIARQWRLRPVPDKPVDLQPLLTLRPRDGVWLRPERR